MSMTEWGKTAIGRNLVAAINRVNAAQRQIDDGRWDWSPPDHLLHNRDEAARDVVDIIQQIVQISGTEPEQE